MGSADGLWSGGAGGRSRKCRSGLWRRLIQAGRSRAQWDFWHEPHHTIAFALKRADIQGDGNARELLWREIKSWNNNRCARSGGNFLGENRCVWSCRCLRFVGGNRLGRCRGRSDEATDHAGTCTGGVVGVGELLVTGVRWLWWVASENLELISDCSGLWGAPSVSDPDNPLQCTYVI